MIFVHAGVLSGDSEGLEDGYVIHKDMNGILAASASTSWALGLVKV